MRVMIKMWTLFTDSFGTPWMSQRGDKDGATIITWAKFFFKYDPLDILQASRSVIETWTGTFMPTLTDFRQYVDDAKRNRESTEIGHGQNALTHQREPVSKEFSRKLRAHFAKIGKSPECKEASDRDVESYEDSFKNLDLAKRWPE